MTAQAAKPASADGAGFTWVLEHILAYPGTYEIPLRTMYTLNSSSQSQPPSPTTMVGNAFPSSKKHDQTTMATVTAAAQLRANLVNHVSAQSAQPQSLPPAFITNYVRRCFAPQLDQVDFPSALTALDYLKDLENRRRSELLAALGHLGISGAEHVQDAEKLAKDHPNAYQWIKGIGEKQHKIDLLYTHVYLGLRRWTMVNEMSLTPFNKQSCLAMLNTLYPPVLKGSQFVSPTKQLTAGILESQRSHFFQYVQAVEKSGPCILNNVMAQHARPDKGEENGWPKVREDLDNYLRMANSIIEQCLETTGRSISPRTATFNHAELDDEQKRKVDSGVSFGSVSGYTSNRSSGQSHMTRPSTSSSISNHSRQTSRDKQADKAHPLSSEEDDTITLKPAGSALERIARELRRIGSRGNMREEPRPRTAVNTQAEDTAAPETDSPPPTPGRGLRWKRSLKNMRAVSRSRSGSTSRPGSRNGSASHMEDLPDFDADKMRLQREAYEAQKGNTR